MSRVSIDSLLAEKRASTTVAKVEEKSVPSFSDDEIEKMASLLSDPGEVVGDETWQEKIAQALILGQVLSSIKK